MRAPASLSIGIPNVKLAFFLVTLNRRQTFGGNSKRKTLNRTRGLTFPYCFWGYFRNAGDPARGQLDALELGQPEETSSLGSAGTISGV